MKALHKYMVKRSALLLSFSFEGDQSYQLQKNFAWKKLIAQVSRNKSDGKALYYVWAASNSDVDPSIAQDSMFFDSDSDDDSETQSEQSKRILTSNHLFGFCVMYCSKDKWDTSYSENYQRQATTKQSSMAVSSKTNQTRQAASFQPGDFRNRHGYRTNRGVNIPVNTRISRSDYAIDFSRLKLAWNVHVPKDMERIVGKTLSQSNTPLSQEAATPRRAIRTGASMIRRPSGLSQSSQSASQPSGLSRDSPPYELPEQETPLSQGSQTVQASQEDFSALFSLLGSESDDE